MPKTKRRTFTRDQKAQVIKKIETLMSKGVGKMEAIKKAGLSKGNYYDWTALSKEPSNNVVTYDVKKTIRRKPRWDKKESSERVVAFIGSPSVVSQMIKESNLIG